MALRASPRTALNTAGGATRAMLAFYVHVKHAGRAAASEQGRVAGGDSLIALHLQEWVTSSSLLPRGNIDPISIAFSQFLPWGKKSRQLSSAFFVSSALANLRNCCLKGREEGLLKAPFVQFLCPPFVLLFVSQVGNNYTRC